MATDLKVSSRPLGSTGLNVSVLGLGTVKFGRNIGVKNRVADGFQLPSDREIEELLDLSLMHGINLIDTAPAYGVSEERLGKVLGARREQFVISTKVGEQFNGESSTYDFSEGAIRRSVELSLKRLRSERLECVLLHLPQNDLASMVESDALEVLAALKQEGAIAAYGASTHTVSGGEYALEHSDLVMLPFNPGYQKHLPVIRRAEELKKGIFIKKGFLSGHLESDDPAKSVRSCLSVVLRERGVSSLIVGTINPVHLRENITLCCEVEDQIGRAR